MPEYFVVDAHLHIYKMQEIGRQALAGWHISVTF